MAKSINPVFLRFFVPLIESLNHLGGSGIPSEVIDLAIEKLEISESEQEETLKSGGSKVRNQAMFARLYLVKAGYISSSQKGVWSLTEKARKEGLTREQAKLIIQEQRKKFSDARKTKISDDVDNEEISVADSQDDIELLDILKDLPPDGFERICQRLLRESGFQEVKVTGKSGDGGIDGYGVLQVNPLVSFNVLFQCKRFKGSVSPSIIRDFRGAMQGRADKGIIITTGTFTAESKKEARRDGAPPIELVDGDKLVEMFQTLELGVIPKTVYEIEDSFFDDFRGAI
ncbi:MAG: restriction endonuclease [Melioribacteraceae bacterium]|nr:restriction endonuclease [Melioribacteraceae bacterium]